MANAEHFLNKQRLPVQVVVSWLNEYGVYCNCDVLADVDEQFENL